MKGLERSLWSILPSQPVALFMLHIGRPPFCISLLGLLPGPYTSSFYVNSNVHAEFLYNSYFGGGAANRIRYKSPAPA